MKKYMNEKEASERSGLSQSWHQRKRWDGSGPPFIKGDDIGRVLYDVDEYDAWFKARQKQSTSEYETRTPTNRLKPLVVLVS